jgi:hypothetical protein
MWPAGRQLEHTGPDKEQTHNYFQGHEDHTLFHKNADLLKAMSHIETDTTSFHIRVAVRSLRHNGSSLNVK